MLVTTCVYGSSPRVAMVRTNIASGERASYADFHVTGAFSLLDRRYKAV